MTKPIEVKGTLGTYSFFSQLVECLGTELGKRENNSHILSYSAELLCPQVFYFYTMATLADELAADLDFTDEEEEEVRSEYDEEEEARNNLEKEKESKDLSTDMDLDDEIKDNVQENANSIKKICKLLYSKQTQDVLKVKKVEIDFL